MPNLVLLDIELADVNGIDALQAMRECHTGLRFLVFSASTCDHYIAAALDANVTGYISKLAPPAMVVAGIRQVANGKQYFCEIAGQRIMYQRRSRTDQPRPIARAATLTQRELTIVRCLSQGLAVKEVARILDISPKTVENHKQNIMTKLDIHDRVELARFAMREGIVGL